MSNATTADTHLYVLVVTHMTPDGRPYGDTEVCLCCDTTRPAGIPWNPQN